MEYEPELMFDENQLQEAKRHWADSLGRMTSNLPEFDEVIGNLRDILFEESELAEFVKDLKGEHLDDIHRGDKTEPLLHRAAVLLLQKLNEKKKKDVMQALEALHWLYKDTKYAPKLGPPGLSAMVEITGDKDEEIKTFATTVMAVMEKNGAELVTNFAETP